MAVGTTRGKRRLGRYVRAIYERAGSPPKSRVAADAGVSEQTVNRLLVGDNLLRWPNCNTILGVLGATPDELAEARRLHQIADVDPGRIKHYKSLPESYRRLRLDEFEAVGERSLDPMLIPGMLQTEDYAAAVARAAYLRIDGPAWTDQAAEERRDRQSLLDRTPEPLTYHTLIDEAALRREVGGEAVMANQLAHLLEVGQRPNVTIQVVPWKLGAYGAHLGAFQILTFAGDDETDAVWVEGWTGTQVIEDPTSVELLRRVWDAIAGAARTPDESRLIIEAIANGWADV